MALLGPGARSNFAQILGFVVDWKASDTPCSSQFECQLSPGLLSPPFRWQYYTPLERRTPRLHWWSLLSINLVYSSFLMAGSYPTFVWSGTKLILSKEELVSKYWWRISKLVLELFISIRYTANSNQDVRKGCGWSSFWVEKHPEVGRRYFPRNQGRGLSLSVGCFIQPSSAVFSECNNSKKRD